MKLITIREFESLCAVADGEAEGSAIGLKRVGIRQRRFEQLKRCLASMADKDPVADQLMRFHRHGGVDLLTAQNYVGVIRFADGAQIEILPKIEIDDGEGCRSVSSDSETVSVQKKELKKRTRKIFLKMLRALLDYEDKAKSSGAARVDDSQMRVFDFFVRRFLDDVAKLVKRGLKGGYSSIAANERFFKGKLNVAENIRQNDVHKERFFVEYDVFSSDAPENRLIKATLELLRGETANVGCQNDIRRLLQVLDEVPCSRNVDADLSSANAVRNGELYKSIIDWCGVFLRGRGFATFTGAHDVQALLFPMEKIFEAYVAHVVRKNADGWSVNVQGGGGFRRWLFDEPTGCFALKPDIVLSKGAELILVDTKWKRLDKGERHYGISQGDMYQMYAYGKRYAEDGRRVRGLHLVYPDRLEVDQSVLPTFMSGVGHAANSCENAVRVGIDLFRFGVGDDRDFVKRLLNEKSCAQSRCGGMV